MLQILEGKSRVGWDLYCPCEELSADWWSNSSAGSNYLSDFLKGTDCIFTSIVREAIDLIGKLLESMLWRVNNSRNDLLEAKQLSRSGRMRKDVIQVSRHDEFRGVVAVANRREVGFATIDFRLLLRAQVDPEQRWLGFHDEIQSLRAVQLN